MSVFIILMSLSTLFMSVWLYLMRDRFSYKTYAIIPLAILHVVYGVVSVRIFAFAEKGFHSVNKGAMSLFGAVFLLPLLFYIDSRILKCKPQKVFDIFTVGMIFSVLCARINCIIAGCCKGIMFFGTEHRWPTREIEVIFYLILMEIFVYRIRKDKTKGEIYPVYMISYGVLRFILEFIRESDQTGIFHRAHYWSSLSVLIGVVALLVVKKRDYKGV